jgi:trafficking protein particle complex subunit 6
MDYLLIEVVNSLRISSAIAAARAKKIEQEMVEVGLVPPPPAALPKNQRDSAASGRGTTEHTPSADDDEGLRTRLESIGLHVGANFTERCVHAS